MARAQISPPQIVILAVMLPGISGFDVCAGLQSFDSAASIIMLTARDDVDDRVRGLDAGADDYLVKPFAFSELVARLRALRRRELSLPQTRLEAGGVVVDVLARTVTVQLTQLGQLRGAGVLTDAEFEAQKQRVLATG